MMIGSKKIGGADLFFVVEEGQANGGNFAKALNMIDVAGRVGADAIEFQLAIAEDFYVKNDPGYGVYCKRQFNETQITGLVKCAQDKGLAFIAAPLSHNLVEPLVRAGCAAFNINASDINNPDILDAVASSGLPFFISLLLASEDEIEWAIARVNKMRSGSFGLLHGQHVMASGHAGVDPEHTALGYMDTLKTQYRIPVGFIDHSPFSWFPAVAVAAGADIVTKHLTISRSGKGPDWQVCLEPHEMREAIAHCRSIRKSYLVDFKKIAPQEDQDKKIMRRSIVAARSLQSGAVLQRRDLVFKRPGGGVEPSKYDFFVGKQLLRDVNADEQIQFLDIGQ